MDVRECLCNTWIVAIHCTVWPLPRQWWISHRTDKQLQMSLDRLARYIMRPIHQLCTSSVRNRFSHKTGE